MGPFGYLHLPNTSIDDPLCMSNTVWMAEGNTHYTHVFIFLTGFPR